MLYISLKKIFELLNAKEKSNAYLLLGLMVFGSVLEIVSLGLLPGFIAIVSTPEIIEKYSWLKNALENLHITSQKELILYGSITIIIVFVSKNIFAAYLINKRINYVSKIQLRLSSELLRLYYNAPFTFHLNRNSTNLLNMLSDEVRLLVTNVLLPSLGLIMDTLFTFSTLILLVMVEPMISISAFVIFGLAGIGYWFAIRKKSLKYGSQLSHMRTQLSKRIIEGLGGLKDARVLNRESFFMNKTKESFKKTTEASMHQQVVGQMSRPVIETVAILGMLSIVVIVVLQGRPMAGILSVLALFAIAAVRLLPTVNNILAGYAGIRTFIHTVDLVYADFKSLGKEENILQDENDRLLMFNNFISINDIVYSYPNTDQPSVKGVSLEIKKGEAIGFVGSSGAGKTTLVDILLGLLKPQTGKIEVDGIDVFKDIRAWQKNIGYIPQAIFLADNTIKRNIAFGIEDDEIEETKLWDAIKAAQLDSLINELPTGLETEIGERGVRLSGGQRQRIGIARALYHNPQILIMDEATSALDNITEKYVVEAIERLKGNRTIITIAHRLTTVENCDMLYLMKEGKIIANGTYTELLKHSEEFKKMNV